MVMLFFYTQRDLESVSEQAKDLEIDQDLFFTSTPAMEEIAAAVSSG